MSWRVVAAELADCLVEGAGLLEVADVTGAWDDHELGIRDRVLELACDPERRTRVRVTPDQQGWHGDAGSRSRWSVSAITDSRAPRLAGRAVAVISSRRARELGRGLAGEQPGRVIALSAASILRTPSTRARTSSAGSDPFHPLAAREDQRRHPLEMVAVELLHDRGAPGKTRDVR